MPTPSRLDPAKLNIPDDAWELVEVTEDFVRHQALLERYADGTAAYVQRTTPRGADRLIAYNQHRLNESQTQRFGDGKVVASIPTNVLFDPRNQIAAKLKEGDQDHLKWFLNRDDARPWRSFRGRL